MAKEDLYVSIPQDKYRENKQEILNTEITLLNILKHLETIRQIRREKADLKIQLKQQIISMIERVNKLKAELPELPAERHGTHEKHNIGIKEITREKHFDKDSERKMMEIEKELREINDKLRKLNS
jgi:hypothetical protein